MEDMCTDKPCRDCTYRAWGNIRGYLCSRTAKKKCDLVSGRYIQDINKMYCCDAERSEVGLVDRLWQHTDKCGRAGKYFKRIGMM